jgi:hypothetical protein
MEEKPLWERIEEDKQRLKAYEANAEYDRQFGYVKLFPFLDPFHPFSFSKLVGVFFLIIGVFGFAGLSTVRWGAPSPLVALIFGVAFYFAAAYPLLRLGLAAYFAFRFFPIQAIAESEVPFYAIPINVWIPSLFFVLMALSAISSIRSTKQLKS